jgi:hypothetical protein
MSESGARAGASPAPEHRQFDFWLGEWEVRSPEGKVVGHNRVTRLFDATGLREEWAGASGLRGTSLNLYDAARGRWHQTWIDSSGTVLLLDGGLRDGTMVLVGESPADGDPEATVRHRISWSLIDGDPDQVRQHWETSADGASWETAFDGRYRRVER